MKKCLLFFSFFLAIFSGCENIQKSDIHSESETDDKKIEVIFDEEFFYRKKAEWEAAGIKNYCFTETFLLHGDELNVVRKTTLKDGKVEKNEFYKYDFENCNIYGELIDVNSVSTDSSAEDKYLAANWAESLQPDKEATIDNVYLKIFSFYKLVKTKDLISEGVAYYEIPVKYDVNIPVPLYYVPKIKMSDEWLEKNADEIGWIAPYSGTGWFGEILDFTILE